MSAKCHGHTTYLHQITQKLKIQKYHPMPDFFVNSARKCICCNMMKSLYHHFLLWFGLKITCLLVLINYYGQGMIWKMTLGIGCSWNLPSSCGENGIYNAELFVKDCKNKSQTQSFLVPTIKMLLQNISSKLLCLWLKTFGSCSFPLEEKWGQIVLLSWKCWSNVSKMSSTFVNYDKFDWQPKNVRQNRQE